MFAIAKTSIQVEELRNHLMDERAGALSTFEGWVRNSNDGRTVLTLEYEAYEELCLKEADKILAEASHQFEILSVRCVHRVGLLKPGDLAVWVAATACHRGDAFAACRYVIDEIKSRLPIWKKETYEDGQSGWVNCQSSCHQPTHSKALATSQPSGGAH